MTPTEQTSTAHGSGNSVNVTIGGEGIRFLAILIVCLIIVLLVTVPISLDARNKAERTVADVERHDREMAQKIDVLTKQYALANYWMQRVEAATYAKGISVPLDPTTKQAISKR